MINWQQNNRAIQRFTSKENALAAKLPETPRQVLQAAFPEFNYKIGVVAKDERRFQRMWLVWDQQGRREIKAQKN